MLADITAYRLAEIRMKPGLPRRAQASLRRRFIDAVKSGEVEFGEIVVPAMVERDELPRPDHGVDSRDQEAFFAQLAQDIESDSEKPEERTEREEWLGGEGNAADDEQGEPWNEG